MQELDFIYKRHSVRKFQATPVPLDHVKEIIKAATYAPSGKNKQNWHFVIVNNTQKIAEIARIVEQTNNKLAGYLQEEKAKALKGMVPYHTVFKNAPMMILVYASSYPNIYDDLLEAQIMPKSEAEPYSRPNPGIQNIGAAMENLLLAAANLGYGTCWMTGPTYAAKEISDYIGFRREGFYLAAVTPLGIPAEQPNFPKRKPLEEILTIID